MEKKHTFSRLGLGLALMLTFGILSNNILISLSPAIFGSMTGSMIATYIGMYGIGLPVFYQLTKHLPQAQIRAKQPASITDIGKFYAMSIGGMVIINMIFTLIMQVLTGKNGNVLAGVISNFSLWQTLLIVVIFAPIIEELVFRKLIYNLVGDYGQKTYVIVSGLMFGLFHGNIGQSLYTFWIGMLVAILYYKTGSIIYPIILHMLVNFTGSFLPLLIGENMVALGFIGLFYLVLIVVALVLVIKHRHYFKHIDDGSQTATVEKVTAKVLLINPGMLIYLVVCGGMMLLTLYMQIKL